MLFESFFAIAFSLLVETIRVAAASNSSDVLSSSNGTDESNNRHALFQKCEKDNLISRCTPFQLIDGKIEKIDADVLCDLIHRICKDEEICVITSVNFKDVKTHSLEKFRRHNAKVYESMGKIGGGFLCIINLEFFVENIRGSYSDNCDKIHGGFLEIAKVYKESNNLVL